MNEPQRVSRIAFVIAVWRLRFPLAFRSGRCIVRKFKAGRQRPNHVDFLHVEFQNVDLLVENLLQIGPRPTEIAVHKLFDVSPSLRFESDAKVVVVDPLGQEDRRDAARTDGQRAAVKHAAEGRRKSGGMRRRKRRESGI